MFSLICKTRPKIKIMKVTVIIMRGTISWGNHWARERERRRCKEVNMIEKIYIYIHMYVCMKLE
jgi:hypothetical protein